jgi:hypothetical protein
LTSTYFGPDPPDDENDKRRYGYSRDKRRRPDQRPSPNPYAIKEIGGAQAE